MLTQTVNAICAGRCYVQKIVVAANSANTGRYICKKGEKPMERLFYITKGVFYIHEKGEKEIAAPEGTLLYLPTDVEYVSYWAQTAEASYIALNYNLYGVNGEPLCLNDHITVTTNDKNRAVYQLLKECANTYIQNEKYAGLALQSYFFKLIYTIFRQQNQKAMQTDKSLAEIYKAILYLDDQYMFEITTEELAAMCNLSVATFRRLFKKYKQTSPMKYRRQLRMAHAKNMLESGVYTVSEVAELMGCTDLSHFNRQYHAVFGLNPSVSKRRID